MSSDLIQCDRAQIHHKRFESFYIPRSKRRFLLQHANGEVLRFVDQVSGDRRSVIDQTFATPYCDEGVDVELEESVWSSFRAHHTLHLTRQNKFVCTCSFAYPSRQPTSCDGNRHKSHMQWMPLASRHTLGEHQAMQDESGRGCNGLVMSSCRKSLQLQCNTVRNAKGSLSKDPHVLRKTLEHTTHDCIVDITPSTYPLSTHPNHIAKYGLSMSTFHSQ